MRTRKYYAVEVVVSSTYKKDTPYAVRMDVIKALRAMGFAIKKSFVEDITHRGIPKSDPALGGRLK